MGAQAAQSDSGRAWDGVIRREIDVEFRSINEDERSFEVVASTETLDSHGDVLRQFWDLSRYQKNGPVLWNHNLALYMGGETEDTLPIGKALEVKVEGKKLVARLALLKGDATTEPLVDKIWRRVQQGVIKAVSVGFRPGQVTRKVNAAGETEYYELGSKDRPNELREISLVAMGSNPDAVAKSIAWERRHLDESIAADAAQERKTIMAMTDEEKRAFDAAVIAKGVAESNLSTVNEKVKTLEAEVLTEKRAVTKLETDLATANKSLTESNAARAKSSLDALQGVKFAPAEREELDGCVKDLGIDRVLKLLEKRSDIALTSPVTVEGKGLPSGAPAPAPVEGSGNGSADLAAEATKGI